MGVIGVGLVLSGIAGVFFSLFYLIIPSFRGLAAERPKKLNLTEATNTTEYIEPSESARFIFFCGWGLLGASILSAFFGVSHWSGPPPPWDARRVIMVVLGIVGFFTALFLIPSASRKLMKSILHERNLTAEKYDEIYRTWGKPFTTRARLLRLVEPRYRKLIEAIDSKDVTLEDVLRLVVVKLQDAGGSRFAGFLESASFLDNIFDARMTDTRLVDFCVGGGWLPPHERPARITPVPISEYYEAGTKDLPTDATTFYALTRDDEYAYTFDITQSCCFNLILSPDESLTPTQMEHFWTALQPLKHPVSLEIIGDGTKNVVAFQLLCHADDKTLVYNQLAALFPDSSINPEGNDDDFLTTQMETPAQFLKNFDAHGISFGLGSHYSYPIRTWTSYDKTDPLGSFLNLLSDIPQDGGAVIQAMIYPLKNWEDNFKHIRNMKEGYRDDERGYKKLPVDQKRRYPLCAVSLRSMSFFKKQKPAHEAPHTFSESVEKAMQAFRLADGNCITSEPIELLGAKVPRAITTYREVKDDEGKTHEEIVMIPLAIPKLYATISPQLSEQELEAVLTRNTYRTGFILNTQELASLCHFPHAALQHPKLVRQDSTFAKAPEHLTTGQGLLIGINEVFGQSKEVYVPEDLRFRHMYVVGKTGMGKTAFLYNMIKNDIEAGKGVGLIDPHGDLVEDVLTAIPEDRMDDVILFDPSDYEHPIGFNMFQANTAQERRQLRSDILISIRRLFEGASWGDNIDQLFRVSIATLLADTTQTHTLIDIRRLIGDEVFRSDVLGRVGDDYLQEFWREDFPSFTRLTTSAVRRRLGSVLSEPEVRNILNQKETSFNFKEMMDTNKIFLAKLSRGSLGEDISSLFGGLLVSKIQLTAMARDAQPEHERVPFYLYVDEFQNFVNEGFGVILSEARKYKLSLTMAHQFTAQLPRDIYNAVFGNVSTLIAFATGVDDATALEKQFGKFSREDIINLEEYNTITSIGGGRDAFSMKTIKPIYGTPDIRERVREASREKYAQRVGDTPPEQEPQELPELPEIHTRRAEDTPEMHPEPPVSEPTPAPLPEAPEEFFEKPVGNPKNPDATDGVTPDKKQPTEDEEDTNIDFFE